MEFTVDPDRTGTLTVDGCAIAWARWGVDDRPPIVLVHGASASLGWWDAVIVPLARAGRRVVGLELSGHAASGHREDYGGAQWAREVLAVLTEIAGPPALLVGHSLGGRVSVLAAAAGGPALVPRLVLVDAPIRRPGGATRPLPPPRRGVALDYATLEEAIAAFRLRPREPAIADPGLMRRVAANAYEATDHGWRLRADLRVFNRISDEQLAAGLAAVTVPLTLIAGRHSALMSPDMHAFLAATHPGETDVVELDGHHHLTLTHGDEVAEIIGQRWQRLRGAGADADLVRRGRP